MLPGEKERDVGAISGRPSKATLALSVFVAFCSLAFSLRSYQVAHPPEFDRGWIFSWLVAGWSSALALALSRQANRWRRVGLGLAAILSMLAFAVPTWCYFENYTDMPLLAVLPFAIGNAILGWWSGQKTVGMLPLAVGALAFFGARIPPAPISPVRQGDLVLESFVSDSDLIGFQFKSASGRPLEAAYDWDNARIEDASIGIVLPRLRPHPSTLPWYEGQEPDRFDLHLNMSMPTWAKSWGGKLIVPAWFAATVARFSVNPTGTSGGGDPPAVTLSRFRVTSDEPRSSSYAFRASFNDLGKHLRFRATDSEGHRYEIVVSSDKDLPVGSYDLEIFWPEGREIRVEVFSGQPHELVFPLDHVRRP